MSEICSIGNGAIVCPGETQARYFLFLCEDILNRIRLHGFMEVLRSRD